MGRIPFAIFLICSLFCAKMLAQSNPDSVATERVFIIENADTFQQSVENGQTIRRAIGRVRARQGDTFLRAVRATEFVDRHEALLVNQVRITEAGDTLFADRVLYRTNTKIGTATGNVRLSDGEAILRAPSGIYEVTPKQARFSESVELEDSVSTLTSLSGAYWLREKRAEFYDNVRLHQADLLLEADSVTHERETERSQARGNVFILRIDSTNTDTPPAQTFIAAGWVDYDKPNGYSRAEQNPLLMRLQTDSSGVDTLLVKAQKVETLQKDSLQQMIAVGAVQFWKTDFSARCDSSVYQQRRAVVDGDTVEVEDITLFGDPMAWFDESQVVGDTIRVQLRAGVVERLDVARNAFIAQRDTTLNRIHQLRGETMQGRFADGDLVQLTARPDAEMIYFRATEEGTLDSAIQAAADIAQFFFENKEIIDVHLARAPGSTIHPEGTIFPADLLPDPLQLQGYRWQPALRPSRDALLPPLLLARFQTLAETFATLQQ